MADKKRVLVIGLDPKLIDFSLPGCPPSANVIWAFLTELLAGRDPTPRPGTFRYD